MTAFFVAGELADPGLEATYDRLRERSRVAFGCPAKPRRIFRLECRLHGCDCEIEVGRPMPPGEDIVVAILDHGREEAFAVYTDAAAGLAVRVQHPAYSVTEFS